MKKLLTTLIATSLVVSAPSYALFGLGDKDSDSVNKLATQLNDSVKSSSGLISSLTDQLGVSPTQAAGGAGALIAMASNELTGSTGDELNALSPKISSLLSSAKSASSSIDSMSAVTAAFEKLGLDSSMVEQFVPIVLDYLGNEGASSDLLGSLTSLWK
ncbi:DUF2780 domain-containing protein [Vibrio rumoiensis]|uniref:DUF2780 domain-containing protein n=1 Tax=Vibrio rumoiensis 1S-45 TaxID=1188252 RepID=A0A1E5DYX2_9VIBR|nr:DUF2780 domain-containing protein [Vibrio rumoiensis]OEF23010.1 hypothetical protein A1QC_13130 [Vibrio rumoiensis 1S-45]